MGLIFSTDWAILTRLPGEVTGSSGGDWVRGQCRIGGREGVVDEGKVRTKGITSFFLSSSVNAECIFNDVYRKRSVNIVGSYSCDIAIQELPMKHCHAPLTGNIT